MGCTCSSANQKGSIEIVNNLKKYFSFESMILEGKITQETYENIDFMQKQINNLSIEEQLFTEDNIKQKRKKMSN